MNSNKRTVNGTKTKGEEPKSTKNRKMIIDGNSRLYKDFKNYQIELDTRNDKYERLVKISRDVTIHSKRAIFCLLRRQDETVVEAEGKIDEVKILLSKIYEEVKDEDLYRFLRSFSPGLQEFIEAISLLYYLKHKKVITFQETKELYFCSTEILLTFYDYAYGIADLTGELMRMAINSVGNGDFSSVDEICTVLQQIYSEFSSFGSRQREMSRKLATMKQSLQKVENASYQLKVRKSEIPTEMLTDIFTSDKPFEDSDT